MKFCKDCSHYSEPWGALCDRPELLEPDPVDGPQSSSPRGNREDETRCGLQARFFDDKVPLRKRLWRSLMAGDG